MYSENFVVKIGSNQFKGCFQSGEETLVLIEKKPFRIEILKKLGHNLFSVSVNGKVCFVEAKYTESGLLTLTYDGFVYEVEVTDETTELLKKYIKASEQNSVGFVRMRAPMPGLVIKVLVEEGAVVHKGDKVIIIEAMKMENALSAPISGKVQKIYVAEGNAVEKEAFLLEIGT